MENNNFQAIEIISVLNENETLPQILTVPEIKIIADKETEKKTMFNTIRS